MNYKKLALQFVRERYVFGLFIWLIIDENTLQPCGGLKANGTDPQPELQANKDIHACQHTVHTYGK